MALRTACRPRNFRFNVSSLSIELPSGRAYIRFHASPLSRAYSPHTYRHTTPRVPADTPQPHSIPRHPAPLLHSVAWQPAHVPSLSFTLVAPDHTHVQVRRWGRFVRSYLPLNEPSTTVDHRRHPSVIRGSSTNKQPSFLQKCNYLRIHTCWTRIAESPRPPSFEELQRHQPYNTGHMWKRSSVCKNAFDMFISAKTYRSSRN